MLYNLTEHFSGLVYMYIILSNNIQSYVYDSYKLAKCTHRRACREAFNTNIRQTYRTLNRLQKTKNSNQFWYVMKQSKQQRKCSDVGPKMLTTYGSK